MEKSEEKITQNIVILCEAADDAVFLRRLLSHNGIMGFNVFPNTDLTKSKGGGNTFWTEGLNSLMGDSGFKNVKCILIAADSDDDPQEAFAKVKDAISKTSDLPSSRTTTRLPVPDRLLEIAENDPALVVMTIPWVDSPGCLESMCYEAGSSSNTTIRGCVEEFMTCVNAGTWDNANNKAKAKLRVLVTGSHGKDPLIWFRDIWDKAPDIIPIASDTFSKIVEFLKRLKSYYSA